jgi:type VI secretion system secreted protein Hcp
MYDAFMKIGDIAGESTDDKHKDWIEVLSFSWGAATALNSGIVPEDFNFVLKVDKSSPLLFKYFSLQSKIENAIVAVRKAGDKKGDFMEYKLKDVIITSFSPATRAQASSATHLTGGLPSAIANTVQGANGGSGDEVAAAGFTFRPDAVMYTVIGLDGQAVSFELNFRAGDLR